MFSGGLKDKIGNYIKREFQGCHHKKDQTLSILEDDSEESTRLRSSSPFTGILSEKERKTIFEQYRNFL